MPLAGAASWRFSTGCVSVKVKGRRWPEGSGRDLCACACISCAWAQTAENLHFPELFGQASGHVDVNVGNLQWCQGMSELPVVFITQTSLLNSATTWSGWWSEDGTSWLWKL